MALEALSSKNDFLNFILHHTISSHSLDNTFSLHHALIPCQNHTVNVPISSSLQLSQEMKLTGEETAAAARPNSAASERRKRRRKARVCKNKEEAESQRMTHIAVERNRRKQMNEHLAVLRSLMPESYVQRGDQASIVGGAIEFVKELEHLLQSLEAKKMEILRGCHGHEEASSSKALLTPFSHFFLCPQAFDCKFGSKKTKAVIADIEVTLIETRANLKIVSRRSPKQLLKLVAGFQTLFLTVLHVNVTTVDNLVLYSISAKVEEGCQLSSVDDIAAEVHHLLGIIEEEDEAVRTLH